MELLNQTIQQSAQAGLSFLLLLGAVIVLGKFSFAAIKALKAELEATKAEFKNFRETEAAKTNQTLLACLKQLEISNNVIQDCKSVMEDSTEAIRATNQFIRDFTTKH